MSYNWLLVLLLPSFALAGGVRQDVEQSVGDTVVNAGDTSIGGNDTKAYAFSHGLGDVDIADCLASVQRGSIIVSWQNNKLNKWCAAEIYDAKGLYDMAALMRCDMEEVAKHFATQAACIEANKVQAPPPHNPVQADDCDDDCEDQLEQVVALEERLAVLEQLRQEDATRARYAAREARQAKEAANQGITEEQRQALAEVFKK